MPNPEHSFMATQTQQLYHKLKCLPHVRERELVMQKALCICHLPITIKQVCQNRLHGAVTARLREKRLIVFRDCLSAFALINSKKLPSRLLQWDHAFVQEGRKSEHRLCLDIRRNKHRGELRIAVRKALSVRHTSFHNGRQPDLVESRTTSDALPLESCTLLSVFPSCHAVQSREKHNGVDFIAKSF